MPLLRAVRALKHMCKSPQPLMPAGAYFDSDDVLALASKPVIADVAYEQFCNPPKTMQETFVGSSFSNAYREAAEFLNHIFDRVPALMAPAAPGEFKLLDLGCGWGRMLRLLRNKRDLAHIELYGADPLQSALDMCRRALPGVWLSRVGFLPPSDYRDSMFDLVYAYSVFSHLSMDCHLAWARELHRIIKPGGFVCITVQHRDFIDYCRQFRDGRREITGGWQESLAHLFAAPDLTQKYDSGEFLYEPTGGGPDLEAKYYGDSIVPKQFISIRWGEIGFELVDWWEHPGPEHGGQNRVLLRKVSAVGGA